MLFTNSRVCSATLSASSNQNGRNSLFGAETLMKPLRWRIRPKGQGSRHGARGRWSLLVRMCSFGQRGLVQGSAPSGTTLASGAVWGQVKLERNQYKRFYGDFGLGGSWRGRGRGSRAIANQVNAGRSEWKQKLSECVLKNTVHVHAVQTIQGKRAHSNSSMWRERGQRHTGVEPRASEAERLKPTRLNRRP